MAANAVYIVEDDRDVCTMLHAVLADEGLTVEEFDSGEAFVAAHPSGAFGCLVVDAGLPGMSGLELVQQLQAGDHHLAAIMLTGQANVAMAVEAMKAGAVDFMQKPVSCKRFIATVRAALDALPARGLCVLYGEPGSGKSFFVLDLVAHILRGQPWAGRRTRRASVVYVSLEGHLRDRVEAYQAHHGLGDGDLDGLRVIQGQPLDLLSDGAAAQLAASIRAALGDHDGAIVVVLDTLARAMPGGNENAGEDMGAAIAACGALERELGALVILVHHAGKDLSRGARGWSGLRGAADAEILIERDGDNRHAKLAKVKDGIDGAAVQFSLQVVDLGPRSEVDPDAGPAERRSSCVAAVTDAHAKPKPNAKTLGRNQRMLLAALRNGPMTRHEAHAFMEKAGVPRRSRYDAIDALLVAGLAIDSVTGLRVKE